MPLPELLYNFHDAGVIDIEVGPRREVTLVVALDDPRFPPHHRVQVRFGGLSNFTEVADYLARVPAPIQSHAYRARIDKLDYAGDAVSKANDLALMLSLEYLGPLTIRCRNITFPPPDTASQAP